jgi:predicted nucleic acid-binding protein
MAITSRKIFIDSTVFFSFIDRSDNNHSKTVKTMERLAATGYNLYTSIQSINDTYAALAREVGLSIALEFLGAMISSNIEILYPQKSEYLAAIKILSSNRDKQISFKEAINATLMERKDISQILTYTYWHNLYGTQSNQ